MPIDIFLSYARTQHTLYTKMLSSYYSWDFQLRSHKEVVSQAFRRKDVRTINLFDKSDLYSKSFLLSNLLSYPSGLGLEKKVFTLPVFSSLQLKSNYKNILKNKFYLHGIEAEPLLFQRRARLLKNRMHRKMRFLSVNFLRGERQRKLFRMRYKKVFSILSKIFIRDNLASRVRPVLKHRILHKYLSRVANKKKV